MIEQVIMIISYLSNNNVEFFISISVVCNILALFHKKGIAGEGEECVQS